MPTDQQTISDEELAAQTAAGSPAAFEVLVHRYENRIYAFVAHSCRNPSDAREVTQDTFVRAFQAITQFDSRLSFRPWLFTIARRKCWDHFRAAPPAAREPMPELADLDDPSELLARREESQDLWRMARAHLSAVQFEALWLRYVEDMDVAQTARVLRKTRTHVKVILFRARQILNRRLAFPAQPSSSVNFAPAALKQGPI